MIAVLVHDYDEAIAWYRDALGFALLEDEDRGGGKRWVRMAPIGNAQFSLLLARATTAAQAAAVGNQHGGRVGFFLHTDDFARDHARLGAVGARFEESPRHETYGTVVVFRDLYGNRWDLIGPRIA
jgi:catechol 2,3-dioxygenase-like lactoylglutathione lyase family enzyme